METAQWPQTRCEKGGSGGAAKQSKAARPQKEQGLNCPRCNSTNTKFCYYNNYSLSQPRYFCKTCRRYWTAGGSLRNIPVGGGSRKNKLRPTSSDHNYHNNSSSDNNNINNIMISSSNNKRVKLTSADLAIDGQDLDLGFMMVPPGYVGPTQDPAPGFSGGLSFSLDGFGLGAGGSTFAFQDLRQLGPGAGGIDGQDRDREGGSGDGFWSGVLGGGGAW